MDRLNSFLESVSKPRYEEDFVDRLNYRITGYILLVVAITLSAKTYVGNPVQCWVPAQFGKGWEQYVENYCFVENTYWVALDHDLPSQVAHREQRQLSYYQWVPFVLALQALMFNIPHLIWRCLNWLSGIEVRAIISMATHPGGISDKPIKKTAKMISRHLIKAFRLCQRQQPDQACYNFAGLSGSYITITYLLVKLMFIGNCIVQFALLNAFLGSQYRYWGAEILADLVAGRDWNDTGHFPRVTMCDFQVRQLGNMHRWTVQCVLMINMFNEKVYLFLWWWFLLVTVVTVLNFIYWLVICSVESIKIGFIKRMLLLHDINISNDEIKSSFLACNDNVFVLRLLCMNAGEIVCSEVVASPWKSDDTKPNKTKPINKSINHS